MRVAALNHASYEWIHHEPIARQFGLSTAQLEVIRDTSSTEATAHRETTLTKLQAAVLAFTDASTIAIKVPDLVFDNLRNEWKAVVGAGESEEAVHGLLVETTLTVASYNMASRVIVALDVGGKMNEPVPTPGQN